MKKNSGFTLIEVLISFLLLTIIFTSIFTVFLFYVKQSHHYAEVINNRRNTRFALNYIEKRIKECNRHEIEYFPHQQTFKGKDYKNNNVWIDLSGNIRYSTGTMLYFHKNRGELRVNKNKEHNVLITGIKDIIVTEIYPGKLIEIKILSDKIDYAVKTRLQLNYN